MLGLVALIIIASITAMALRRIRDRVLTSLAVAGLVLMATPALLVDGDAVERLIAALYIYAPYWEYLLPLALFTLALLPRNKKAKPKRKRKDDSIVTV